MLFDPSPPLPPLPSFPFPSLTYAGELPPAIRTGELPHTHTHKGVEASKHTVLDLRVIVSHLCGIPHWMMMMSSLVQATVTLAVVVATMVRPTSPPAAGPASVGCRESHTSSSSHPVSMWSWRADTTTAGTPGEGASGRGASPQTTILAGSTATCSNAVSGEST